MPQGPSWKSWPRVEWPATAGQSPALVIYAAAALAFACCLFFHGYEIFSFNLSIDEELSLGGEPYRDYLQHGRWGLALRYWLLMRDTTVPMASTATGLALYGAAFVLLIKKLKIQYWGSLAVAAPLFFGFPVLLYGIAFANIALTLGLGAFTAMLALYAADEMRPLRFAGAVFLVAFAIALYQSLLYFVIIVFAADYIRRIWSPAQPLNQEPLRRPVLYAAIILCGLALYALIAFLSLKAFGLQLGYVTQFVRPELVETHPLGAFKATLVEAAKLYSGAAPAFLHLNLYYRILIGICGALLLWGLAATGKASLPLALLLAGLMLVILAAPFLQHPLNGGHLPYRTLLALPAAVALLALFAAEMSPPRLRHWVLVPLAALVAIQFSWINNRQYYAGHWSLERDKAIAAEMLSRIGELLPNQNTYKIAVVGALPRRHGPLNPRVPDSTLDASFFAWDAGSSKRVAAFLNFLSDAKFRPVEAGSAQALAAFEAASTMPSWPAAHSIAQVGDVVVIKLSPPNRTQLGPLCQNRETGICARYQR